MIKLGETKAYKIKLSWILISTIVYIALGIITHGNILFMIGSMLSIVAILNYTHHTILSMGLFTLAELCNTAVYMQQYGVNKTLTNINPELSILIFGTIINLLLVTLGSRKHLANLIQSYLNVKPTKLRLVFRIVLYSILTTFCMTLAIGIGTIDSTQLTLLSSLWAAIPTFTALAIILRLSDMYTLKLINQLVILIIIYMRLSLGQTDIVNTVTTSIVLITVLMGYNEYRNETKK